MKITGSPGTLVVKKPPVNAGDLDSIPGQGRFPREGNGNPLQYSCLGNPMDRGAWWASSWGHKESDRTQHTHTHTHTHTLQSFSTQKGEITIIFIFIIY